MGVNGLEPDNGLDYATRRGPLVPAIHLVSSGLWVGLESLLDVVRYSHQPIDGYVSMNDRT